VKERKAIFWDFDGVIKESVAVKTKSYISVFRKYGSRITDRVRIHHEENGGQSRFEKIPLYLSWVYEKVDQELVERYCDEFASLVVDAVIESEWVPGAREYLQQNCGQQRFVMITATPQGEIEFILKALGIDLFFERVYGAPMSKSKAIKMVLDERFCSVDECLVIGDSESDLEAARVNGLDFLLRQTSLNKNLQVNHSGLICKDFLDEPTRNDIASSL
jgi:HAD superfamily hydrolase (TIGR01549 family)